MATAVPTTATTAPDRPASSNSESGTEGIPSEDEVDPSKLQGNGDVQYKIILLGDSAVGKTSLALRFCYRDVKILEHTSVTLGITSYFKTMGYKGKVLQMHLQDTAGQERFAPVTKQYMRGADGLVLVFSLADPKTFEHVTRWLEQFREANGIGGPEGKPDVPVLLIGNKKDLEYNQEVAYNAAEFIKAQPGTDWFFFMTSVKTGDQIFTAFRKFSTAIHDLHTREMRVRRSTRGSTNAIRFTGTPVDIPASPLTEPTSARRSMRGLPPPPPPVSGGPPQDPAVTVAVDTQRGLVVVPTTACPTPQKKTANTSGKCCTLQ